MSDHFSDLEIRNIGGAEASSKSFTTSKYLGSQVREGREAGPALTKAGGFGNFKSSPAYDGEIGRSGSSTALATTSRIGLRKSIGLGALAPSSEYMTQDRLRSFANYQIPALGSVSGSQNLGARLLNGNSAAQLGRSFTTQGQPVSASAAVYLPTGASELQRNFESSDSSGGIKFSSMARSISTPKLESGAGSSSAGIQGSTAASGVVGVSGNQGVGHSASHSHLYSSTHRHVSIDHLSTPPAKERFTEASGNTLDNMRRSRRSSGQTVKETVLGTTESIITHEPVLVEVRTNGPCTLSLVCADHPWSCVWIESDNQSTDRNTPNQAATDPNTRVGFGV